MRLAPEQDVNQALTCAVTAWLALTSDAADQVILREDFSTSVRGELPRGFSALNGEWSVEKGRLRGSAKGESTVYFGEPAWRDIALSADVSFSDAKNETRWVALLVRDGGPVSPGVQLTARRNTKRGNGLEIAARRAKAEGRGWRVFQTAAAGGDFLKGQTHRLRIEARGDWIRGCFDGQRVFDLPRGSEIGSAGRVGFRISGATVEFDNVVVEALDPPEPFEFSRLRERPLIIAHRGFSHRAPENTLAAYRLAIEAGAELAECDVYLSADGVPVLLHDKSLKRTTGLDKQVSELSLAELKKLDAGRWKSAEFAGERIPTLREALELVKGKLRFVIEIKPKGIEKEVLASIHEAGASPDDVVIFCFHREVVETITRLNPRLTATWLIDDMPWQPDRRRGILASARAAGASIIGLPKTRVDPSVVHLAHSMGLPLYVWTVNDPADMRYLARIGVDGIISDRPDVLRRVIAED